MPQWQALGNDRYRFSGALSVWMNTFSAWYREDVLDSAIPFHEYLTRLTLALAEQCRREWQGSGDRDGLALLRRRLVVRDGRLDLGLFVLLDGLSARCPATALEDWQETVRTAAQRPAGRLPAD